MIKRLGLAKDLLFCSISDSFVSHSNGRFVLKGILYLLQSLVLLTFIERSSPNMSD